MSSTKIIPAERRVAIHPCYSRALHLEPSGLSVDVRLHVSDDELPERSDEETQDRKFEIAPRLQDQRIRQLGKVLVELEHIQHGADDAKKFEEWLFRAVKILFADDLKNPELHPNLAAAQRRDVVATNSANSGFWKRLRDDYSCRQIVFEAKNYSELGPEEFNQAVAYGGHSYGNASFIVHRGTLGLDDAERAHIKARYYGKEHLIVVLPADLLARCLRKQRSARRGDYTEDALGKLLDTYERRYLGEDAGRRKKRRRR